MLDLPLLCEGESDEYMNHLCYKCMLHCICTKYCIYVGISFPASSKAHTMQHATSYSSLLTASSPRSVRLWTSGRGRDEGGINHQSSVSDLARYNCVFVDIYLCHNAPLDDRHPASLQIDHKHVYHVTILQSSSNRQCL